MKQVKLLQLAISTFLILTGLCFVAFPSTSNKFCDLLFQLNLSQLITQPTHNHNNILVLVITSDEDIIQDFNCASM